MRSDGLMGASGDEAPEPVDVDSESFIVGVWVEAKSSCTYTYRFTNAGRFTINATSGEVIGGGYALRKSTAHGDRWLLTLNVATDNNGEDCEGDTIKEEGAVYTITVEPIGNKRIDTFRSETASAAEESWSRR